jgi:methanogenic corrinoid protein MtbC1
MNDDGGPDPHIADGCISDLYSDCLDEGLGGAGQAPGRRASVRWKANLEKAIASEVIPRLLLAHAEEPGLRPAPAPERKPGAEAVAELTRIVLLHDSSIGEAYIEAMKAQGVTLESIYIDLITPAAKLLGEMWKADLCSFADVTIGLARLQQIARHHAPAFEAEGVVSSGDTRRAMLVAMPGEQHTLGIFLVESFLRRAGWDVVGGPAMSSKELMGAVRRDWFALVGLSISADSLVQQLEGVIRMIRRESRNQGVGILVGGRVFVDHPDWVARVGADAMARDAREAVRVAEIMVGAVEGRC